jgi:hypothetical protein
MKRADGAVLSRVARLAIAFLCIAIFPSRVGWAQQPTLCLDGFCIGQTIQDARLDAVAWLTPTKDMVKEDCTGGGCQPENAFRGYAKEDQVKLADALSWKYGGNAYNVITRTTLEYCGTTSMSAIRRHGAYGANDGSLQPIAASPANI